MKLLAVTTTNRDCNARLCYQEGWKQEIQSLTVWFLWFYAALCIKSISGGAITKDEFKNVSVSLHSETVPLLKDLFSSPLSSETNKRAKEALKLYASLFWRPKYSQSIKPYYLKKKYYHIQAAPGGVISPLIRKNPKLFQKILNNVVTPGDFYNVPDTIGESKLNTLWENITAIIRNGMEKEELTVRTDFMQLLIENVLTLPRSVSDHPKNRDVVGGLIFGTLAVSGLMVRTEPFKFSPISFEDNGYTLPQKDRNAINIIGVIPGKFWNTSKDRPLIVGAHWDTYGTSGGLNDNGASIAALLEAARVLSSASCFSPYYSVLFVAFDAEEAGCYGSKEFIASYVKPLLVNEKTEIQGAIILDTIFNYDSEENSQSFSQAWENVAPHLISNSESRKWKGDFLASISRNDPKDRRLAKAFKRNYELITRKRQYEYTDEFIRKNLEMQDSIFHLEDVEIKQINGEKFPSFEKMVEISQLWMSDHSHFWYFLQKEKDNEKLDNAQKWVTKVQYPKNDSNTTMTSFGAILLTDTGYLRGYMKRCYHQSCDNYKEASKNKKRYKNSLAFLATTTQALVFTILELTTKTLDSRKEKYNGNYNHSTVNFKGKKKYAPLRQTLANARYPKEHCENEKKRILSSFVDIRKFIPYPSLKSEKDMKVINNSEEKLLQGKFSVRRNDSEPNEELNLNVSKNFTFLSAEKDLNEKKNVQHYNKEETESSKNDTRGISSDISDHNPTSENSGNSRIHIIPQKDSTAGGQILPHLTTLRDRNYIYTKTPPTIQSTTIKTSLKKISLPRTTVNDSIEIGRNEGPQNTMFGSNEDVSQKVILDEDNAMIYLKNYLSRIHKHNAAIENILHKILHDTVKFDEMNVGNFSIKNVLEDFISMSEENNISPKSGSTPPTSPNLLKSSYFNYIRNAPKDNYTVIQQTYKPNYGGTQVNIENLHIDITENFQNKLPVNHDLAYNKEESSFTSKDFLLLLLNGNKKALSPTKKQEFQGAREQLKSIIQEYYNNYSQNIELKPNTPNNFKRISYHQSSRNNNSPMLIKLLRNEEL